MRPVSGGPPARSSRVKSPQDFVSGLFFLAIGLGALWIARDYPVGTPQRMGTGAFPRMLCWGMILLGAIITLQSFVVVGERLSRWALRPLIWITASVFAFALLVEGVGFVGATVALLLIAALGSPETRWVEVIIFTAAMTLFGIALFIWGLGLPLRMWPL